MKQSGDRCKCGKGRLRKVKSFPSKSLKYQITTFECDSCGDKPPREFVPAENVRRRKLDYLIP